MRPLSSPGVGRALALAALTLVALQAPAQTLLLDAFAAPSPAVNPTAPSQNYVVSTPGSYAGVVGQARDAYYWLYLAGAGASSASIGGGRVSVDAGGAGGYGELGLGYGAYGVSLSGPPGQGPALALDLSGYGELQASFSQANHTLNLIAGLYTSNPLPGGFYYWTGEINLAPAVSGGPVTGNLPFTGGNAQNFNFGQVDGLVFIVDRAAQADGNAYSLTSLQFAQAVPEPASAGMLLAGMAAIGLWRRRRVGARQ
jgi:hypothetical protein